MSLCVFTYMSFFSLSLPSVWGPVSDFTQEAPEVFNPPKCLCRMIFPTSSAWECFSYLIFASVLDGYHNFGEICRWKMVSKICFSFTSLIINANFKFFIFVSHFILLLNCSFLWGKMPIYISNLYINLCTSHIYEKPHQNGELGRERNFKRSVHCQPHRL